MKNQDIMGGKIIPLFKNNIQIGHYELLPNWVKVFNLSGNEVMNKNMDVLEYYLRSDIRTHLNNYLTNLIK